MALATYLTFTHSTIADGISNWQAKLMGDGKYMPALTILLLSLPPLVLLTIIKKLIELKKKR